MNGNSNSDKSPQCDLLSCKRIHIVGIKGTGTSALAEIFSAHGIVVTGSDIADTFYTDTVLKNIGIIPTLFDAANITDDIDLVVHSSAYKVDENPELIAAKKKNIPTLLYTEALGMFSESRFSVAVCGVHGKTTTTGILGTILKSLNFPSQILAGSAVTGFGGKSTLSIFHEGTDCDPIFLAETCEYQRHFMSFSPNLIIMTGVESDHQDYFPTYEDIRDAFVDFCSKLPDGGILVFCSDDPGAAEVANIVAKKRPGIVMIPYGESSSVYRLRYGEIKNGMQSFFVNDTEFAIRIPGKHIALDSCGAVALISQLLKARGVTSDEREKIRRGLADFAGAKRRSEIVAQVAGITIIDDYAHHPTAIEKTLAGLKEFYAGRRLIVDFMSHTYSRTAALLDEFAQSLKGADILILHKIYSSAREKPETFTINGETLFQRAKEYRPSPKETLYFEEILDASDFLMKELQPGDVLITFGAGDNWKLGVEIARRLEVRQ
ncbi:MAG: UDP-N-acetylmuramate--L-alanine ligase [Spirochaetaceae bacterium]|nr:UDP-N-acetylmuramate--L-alanine ligase [Spirochaetaceae bacterium]